MEALLVAYQLKEGKKSSEESLTQRIEASGEAIRLSEGAFGLSTAISPGDLRDQLQESFPECRFSIVTLKTPWAAHRTERTLTWLDKNVKDCKDRTLVLEVERPEPKLKLKPNLG